MNQIWRKLRKGICAVTASACVLTNVLPAVPAAAQENESAMGRYLETEVVLPEEFLIRDVVTTNEGTLRILGMDPKGYAVYDSSDGGATWEKSAVLSQVSGEDYFFSIILNPMGGGAGLLYQSAGEGSDGECSFVSFDEEGNTQRSPISDDLSMILRFSGDGTLLGLSSHDGLMVLDSVTGETKNTITSEGGDLLDTCGNEVLILGESELFRYDIATGEPISRDDALDAALYANGESYMITTTLGTKTVMTEDEEGRLYYTTGEGIFSHIMDGSVVEQIVDGTLGSLSAPGLMFLGMAIWDQSFYVAVADGIDTRLLCYKYDADVPSTPQKELNVYSLRPNDAVRQAAVLFQKKYPDVYVNYKVGMTGEDGVTASDALRTLNTDILAGNGPDVLVLDEMSVDTYTRQGLLTDLSGIVEEIQGSEGLLENVAEAYETDGMIPVIPMKFGMLVAAGNRELIDSIAGLDTIADLAMQTDAVEPYDILNAGEVLYRSCSGSWKNEDRTINQEKLSEFVKGVRKIQGTYRENASEKELEEYDMYLEGEYATWSNMENYSSIAADDIATSMIDLLGSTKVRLGSLNDVLTYVGLCSVNKKNGNGNVKLIQTQQSDVFLPSLTMGVLSTAREAESAMDFVKYMLSYEGQKANQNVGFSVNTKALEEEIYENTYGIDEDGGYTISSSQMDPDGMMVEMELTYTWPSQEELDALYGMAKQVNVAADLERVQHDVVIGELARCLDGEIQEEEAVNAIMQKMNLYLAE